MPRALMVEDLEALQWCRQHNCLVRFESNDTVTVTNNGSKRRRKTVALAVAAHKGDIK